MKTKRTQKDMSRICEECGSRCCRYVAVEIDRPTCKRDYDHIRWYLLHGTVHVFVDHANDWFLEMESDCEALGPGGHCLNYANRPRICRQYGDDHQTCEYLAEEEPFTVRFSTAAEYEAWLDKKRIQWRWKQ